MCIESCEILNLSGGRFLVEFSWFWTPASSRLAYIKSHTNAVQLSMWLKTQPTCWRAPAKGPSPSGPSTWQLCISKLSTECGFSISCAHRPVDTRHHWCDVSVQLQHLGCVGCPYEEEPRMCRGSMGFLCFQINDLPKKKNLFHPFVEMCTGDHLQIAWKGPVNRSWMILCISSPSPSPSATLRMSFSKALRVCCAASNCLHWSSMEWTLGKKIETMCLLSSKVSRNKVKWYVFQLSRSNKHDQQVLYL